MVALIQGGILALAVGWGVARADPFWDHLGWSAWVVLAIPAGLGMSAFSVGAMRISRTLRGVLDEILYPLFATASLRTMLAVALMSGIAEEAFFRGVMQPAWGLGLTCLVFGALHTGNRRLLVMGPWAALAGLVLGWLYVASGTLWCPMLCHAANNLASMLYLKHLYTPACHRSDVGVSIE